MAETQAEAEAIQRAKDEPIVLESLTEGHTLGFAAALVGVKRQALDRWRHENPEFDEAVAYALRESAADVYEEHLLTESKKGIPASTIVGLKMKKRFVEETKVTSQNLDLHLVADLRDQHSVDELRAMLREAEASEIRAKLAIAEGKRNVASE